MISLEIIYFYLVFESKLAKIIIFICSIEMGTQRNLRCASFRMTEVFIFDQWKQKEAPLSPFDSLHYAWEGGGS